jgi:hypothetical protein
LVITLARNWLSCMQENCLDKTGNHQKPFVTKGCGEITSSAG